jgi:hypothetical protein
MSERANRHAMDAEIVIVVIILVIFILIWRAICQYISKKANLVKEITEHTGPQISSSGWGGRASINGMYFKNGVKVIHYEQGYVIKLIPIWGGGKLWIPKKEMSIIEQRTDTLFTFSKTVSIKSGDNAILLYGKLAEQIVT